MRGAAVVICGLILAAALLVTVVNVTTTRQAGASEAGLPVSAAPLK
jgi:hypothetical protein